MLAPALLAQAKGKARRAAAKEDADRAVARLESLLDMERLPRAALLVLGESDIVVGIIVALRSHKSDAGLGTTLQVLRQQAVGSHHRRIGVVVGAHVLVAGVHAALAADRTL